MDSAVVRRGASSPSLSASSIFPPSNLLFPLLSSIMTLHKNTMIRERRGMTLHNSNVMRERRGDSGLVCGRMDDAEGEGGRPPLFSLAEVFLMSVCIPGT